MFILFTGARYLERHGMTAQHWTQFWGGPTIPSSESVYLTSHLMLCFFSFSGYQVANFKGAFTPTLCISYFLRAGDMSDPLSHSWFCHPNVTWLENIMKFLPCSILNSPYTSPLLVTSNPDMGTPLQPDLIFENLHLIALEILYLTPCWNMLSSSHPEECVIHLLIHKWEYLSGSCATKMQVSPSNFHKQDKSMCSSTAL